MLIKKTNRNKPQKCNESEKDSINGIRKINF